MMHTSPVLRNSVAPLIRYIHRADALQNAQHTTDKWKHSRSHWKNIDGIKFITDINFNTTECKSLNKKSVSQHRTQTLSLLKSKNIILLFDKVMIGRYLMHNYDKQYFKHQITRSITLPCSKHLHMPTWPCPCILNTISLS